MKLSLKNIGKIKSADIDINGITVVAGLNNSGKSTVSKSLYCLFSALCNIKQQKENLLVKNLVNTLNIKEDNNSRSQVSAIIQNKAQLVNNPLFLKTTIDKLYSVCSRSNTLIKEDDSAVLDKVSATLKISDAELDNAIVLNEIRKEFDGQLKNLFEDGESYITLTVKGHDIRVDVEKTSIHIDYKEQLTKRVVYYDNPFILDEFPYSDPYSSNHRTALKSLLFQTLRGANADTIEQIKNKDSLAAIYKKLSVCGGSLKRKSEYEIEFASDKEGVAFDIKNLSAGIKSFAVMKSLLECNILEQNGTIILDEPEIHLHPQWQIVLAEVIVLLHIEFGLHILLTSHSPYFIEAVEVYAKKYKCYGKTSFYLTRETRNGSIEIDCKNDSIDEIYRTMLAPYRTLEEVENEKE